jgi:MFS family permease
MNNNNIKPFLLIFIILSFLSSIIYPATYLYLLNIYDGNIPTMVRSKWQMLFSATYLLPNIAVAFWLSHIAKKEKSSPLLWFFFGLVGGLISLAIFYLIRIYEKLNTQQITRTDPE